MLCYDYTDNVWIYTCAIKNIIFNSDILTGINVEANVCIIPGRHSYIPNNVNKVHLLKFIKQGRGKDIETDAEISVSRNFYENNECEGCDHVLLQADKKLVPSPCRKDYDNNEKD